MEQIHIIDAGICAYHEALDIQKSVFDDVARNAIPGGLIVCRHTPVITIGRGGNKDSIKISRPEFYGKAVPVINSERGGGVTYHGPGQATVYPIVDLAVFDNDLHAYLTFLEKTIVETIEKYRIFPRIRDGLRGVWVGGKKIASIGIAVRRRISFHGLTINVGAADLAPFGAIRPCGMDIQVTSIETETGRPVSVEEVQQQYIRSFVNGYRNITGAR